MANSWKDPGDNHNQREPDVTSRAQNPHRESTAWGQEGSAEETELGVFELLQKLESESATDASSIPPPVEISAEEAEVPGSDEVVCRECQTSSSTGQRFCGFCGAPLLHDVAPRPRRPQPPFAAPFGGRSVPFRSGVDSELEFLRSKSLASTEDGKGGWSYLIGGVLVVLLAYGGFRWYTGSEEHPLRPQATMQQNPQPQIQQLPSQPSALTRVPQQKSGEDAPAPASLSGGDRGKEPAAETGLERQPASNRLAEAVPVNEGAGDETGNEELTLAEHYLSNTNPRRDSEQAVKWLWRAVGKQNGRAVLLLSDLYMKGEGVPQSCDQARLLLVTAAKKGVPDAASKLRSLPAHGCQ